MTCIIVFADNEEILYDQEDLTTFYSQKDSVDMIYTPPTSSMSDSQKLVLQINPEAKCGQIRINGKMAQRIAAHIFIPDSNRTINCPLNYFQENASLPGKWITTDSGDNYTLEHVDELRSVIITLIRQGMEMKCELPDDYGIRLLDYFNLDICHNPVWFNGFDCYAFVSLLANVKYDPERPGFEYLDEQAEVGDIVVITSDQRLPESIKHWALYLGNDLYLSKFGKSGEEAQSLVGVTDLNGMMALYDCQRIFIACPVSKAEPWNGYTLQ